MVPSWVDQLLLQLLMEQFDTLPLLCRHIEHMHEGLWLRKNNFWQKDSGENLDNFSLIRCLYMHRWCLHGPINSYHSKKWFWQNDSCENLENFSLIRLLYMHRWCLHGPINSYYSFWWNNLLLWGYNVDTLNICIKEFGLQKMILTKWQLWELRQFFPNKAFVYA